MKVCPRCGKNMVEKPPTEIFLSYPPQWDRIWWCGCGYQESDGRVRGKTAEETLREQWEEANRGTSFGGNVTKSGGTI